MSKHTQQGRLVPKIARIEPATTRGRHEATVPTYLRGQETALDQPAQFLTITECRHLRDRQVGEFINRGKAFRRWDIYGPDDSEQRQFERRLNRVRHWRARNGAMQLVDGDVPGRKGHFVYPVPARGAHTRTMSCAEVNRVPAKDSH